MQTRTVLIVLACVLSLAACATTSEQMEPTITEMEVTSSLAEEKIVEPGGPLPIGWEATAEPWKAMYGYRQTVMLPPNGSASPYYGFGEFSMESSIGSAAVSMELLTYEAGGTVTFEIREGTYYVKGGSEDSYEGWNTVFVFIDANGEDIKPDPGLVLEIPDVDDTEVYVAPPAPAGFTIANNTNTIITYVDIYTNDMMAVDDTGYNLLGDGFLLPGDSVDILFDEHLDLKEAILYRYGQMFHVQAEDALFERYYRTWYPDFDSLTMELTNDHLVVMAAADRSTNTMRIENQTGYHLVELYILTPDMERNLDFDWDLLQDKVIIPDGQTLDIPLELFEYLDTFVASETGEYLLIIAVDDENYMLEHYWNPTFDPWVVTLTYDDYFE